MKDMGVILMPENLRSTLGEPAAKELVELINSTSKGNKEDTLETASDKFERRLSEVKTELVKWMFVFWIGQVAVLMGLLAHYRY